MRDGNLKTVVQIKECDVGKNLHTKGLWYLWEPECNERCWFYTPGVRPVLGEFIEYVKTRKNSPYTIEDGGWFRYCEPFIGKLPSYLKETICTNI